MTLGLFFHASLCPSWTERCYFLHTIDTQNRKQSYKIQYEFFTVLFTSSIVFAGRVCISRRIVHKITVFELPFLCIVFCSSNHRFAHTTRFDSLLPIYRLLHTLSYLSHHHIKLKSNHRNFESSSYITLHKQTK